MTCPPKEWKRWALYFHEYGTVDLAGETTTYAQMASANRAYGKRTKLIRVLITEIPRSRKAAKKK